MNRVMNLVALCFTLLLLTPFSANARDLLRNRPRPGHNGGGGGGSVPELDPSAASAALSLLAGGALVLSGRRRKRD